MVIINGKSYHGNSISISGNKVIIDGVDQTPDAKEINVSVTGNIGNLDVDYCNKLEVFGDVTGKLSTQSGDIEITGNVNGDVKTMSGDVKCGPVSGNVKTMSGDIKNKK